MTVPRIPRRFILAAGAIVLLVPTTVTATILEQFTFGVTGAPTLSATTLAANVTASAITPDSGIAPGIFPDFTSPGGVPTAPYLRLTFNATNATPAAAFAANADIFFTLTANNGYEFNLTSLDFLVENGGTGTRGYDVRSSATNDGFATSLGSATVTTVRVMTPVSINLSGAQYQHLSTITFKIFSFSNGAGSSVEYDNITLNGATTLLSFTGYVWKGNASSNWDTVTANWAGAGSTYVDSTPDSDVLFDDTSATGTVNISGSVSPDSVTFTNSVARNYILNGGPIIVAAGFSKTGNGTVTINNTIISSATATVDEGTVTISPTGAMSAPNLSVGPLGTFTVSPGGTLASNTPLSVSGNVIFNNTVQGLNQISGPTSGVVTLNGTTLTISGPSGYDGKLTGNGSVVKDGTGTLVLTGATSDFTGGITINAGAVQLSGTVTGGTGTITVNAGGALLVQGPIANSSIVNNVTLAGGTLGASGTNGGIAGSLTVTSPSVVTTYNSVTNATGNDVIVTGTLHGNASIALQTLNGNAPDGTAFRLRGPVSTDYTGTITVPQSGKLEIQANSDLGSPMGTGLLVVNAGNFLNNNNTGTFSVINVRNGSGAGVSNANYGNNVQVVGFGATLFNMLNAGGVAAGSASNFGDLLIGDGQTMVAGATGSPRFTLSFATVHLTGGMATFTPQPVGNANYISVDDISLGVISENVAGSGITMNGASNLTLRAANTYTGATIVQSGMLVLGAAGALPAATALTVNGGTVDLNNAGSSFDQTVASLDGFGGVITNSDFGNVRTLTVNLGTGLTTFYLGSLGGNLALSKLGAGTLNLAGASTSLGVATINAGTLIVAGSLTSPLIVNGGKLGGPGFLGPVTVNALGTLAPGDGIGILNTGDLSLNDLSTLSAELAGTTAGTGYDQLNVVGTVTLTGSAALQLQLAPGYDPQDNVDIFTLILNDNAGDFVAGTFGGLANGAIFNSGSQAFQISYADDASTPAFELSGGNDVSLRAVSIPEPCVASGLLGSLALFAGLRRRRAA